MVRGEYPGCVQFNTVARGDALYSNSSIPHVRSDECVAGGCGDMLSVPDLTACATACAKIKTCRMWTFGFQNGMGTCSLKSSNAGQDISLGWVSGSRMCAPPTWPECVEEDVVIRHGGHALFFDATLYGSPAMQGCYLQDCTYTDKFPCPSPAVCGYVCSKVNECSWWSYGEEEGEKKCWLRTHDGGRERSGAHVSGHKSCGAAAPTSTPNRCWSEGFTEAMCCDEAYGPIGNTLCWDERHTFSTCCVS